MQITDYPSFFNIGSISGSDEPLTALVSVVFNFLLIIGILAAIITIIWGGVEYLTSAGDLSRTKSAKKRIFATILGSIILFSAWIILNSINPNLVNPGEPTSTPPPAAPQQETPTKPPAETPAAFYYIPLGQVIDDVISQERETIPKMKDFANSAAECSSDQCNGGSCEYWVSEPCPEEEPPAEEPPAETPPAPDENNWWDTIWIFKTPAAYAEGDCGYWATCSAPCNTGDPCPADRNAVIGEVSAEAEKMEEEISKLQQAKNKISECILQKDTVFLSCQEALYLFGPGENGKPLPQWNAAKDCRGGYDFFCMYGSEEDALLDEITMPFETVEKSIKLVRELADVISTCNCSQCSFCCECCAACSGTPCPSQTYDKLNSAGGAVNELETRFKKLQETVAEIAGLNMADEITTLTCSEAYSWLKLIKESGCPGEKAFPCCPVDAETEKTIRNCRGTDFFFCSSP